MKGGQLYRLINIFRRLKEGEVIVYRCFMKLPDLGYSVQSADRVRLPLQEAELALHDKQLWELLIEEAPESRSGLFPTIEEAIADFERSFEEGEP